MLKSKYFLFVLFVTFIGTIIFKQIGLRFKISDFIVIPLFMVVSLGIIYFFRNKF